MARGGGGFIPADQRLSRLAAEEEGVTSWHPATHVILSVRFACNRFPKATGSRSCGATTGFMGAASLRRSAARKPPLRGTPAQGKPSSCLRANPHSKDKAPEAHMNDIMRTGPPIPIAVRGSEYELNVTLNATPSPEWRRVFQAPDEWSEPCHPSRITVKGQTMIFTSEEARVKVWMEQIDKWIAAANRKRADMAASVTARAGGDGDDQRQKIQEMTDRLKDL